MYCCVFMQCVACSIQLTVALVTDVHSDSGKDITAPLPSPGRRWRMECGEGIEERHTQQQYSVPGPAERGEGEGFTSRFGRQEGIRGGAGDQTASRTG